MVNRDQQIAAMIHSVRHGNEDCFSCFSALIAAFGYT